MTYLHDAHVANVVTAYATLLAGVMPVLYTLLSRRQPGRWLLVYVCIIITAIPTIIHHADPRVAFWTSVDQASNILLVWALHVGLSGDFMTARRRRMFLGISTLLNAGVLAWLVYEAKLPEPLVLLRFGSFGGFQLGELALITNAWIVAGLFFWSYARIPKEARAFLWLVFAVFFAGMGLATASDGQISAGFFAWHATWHLVGAFGFMTLWVFNEIRFLECAGASARKTGLNVGA